MARYRTDMNSIYISPRAQEALDPIAQCPLTTVVAPMGYGKTTAVQWFLDRRREAGDQVVRVSIYSNDLPLFWRSFQAAWRGTPLAGQLDPMAFPVGDTALGLLSERLLDLLDGAGDYYLFLDDYHLMKDDQVTALLLALARLPGAPLHLIVASRDQVLSPSQALRLGRDLHQITAGDLALNQEEVSAYSRRCGVALPPADLAHLAQTSEGWFSAVYLNLKAYQAHGTLLTSGHDIYEMLNEAMLDPLPQERVDFLARMSLADEFTAEQAAFVTGLAESRELMRALTESNTFSDKEATNFRKNDIGFVFQDYMLLDSLTIRENISVALSLKNVDSSKIDDLINSYAKRFNLYEQLKKYPYQLSGGQRQRVSIIRAIIKDPEIIFTDEPTGALDLKSSEETMMILSEINKTEKVTILMVTHDVLSASYADRVILLKDGKLHMEIDKKDCGESFYDVISQALSDRGE